MEKKLIFDLNTIVEFIFNKEESNCGHSEISEMYGINDESGKLELLNRQLNEIKGEKNEATISIKYDIIKNLMSIVNNIQNTDTIGIGETIALDSLIYQGFIKEVEI